MSRTTCKLIGEDIVCKHVHVYTRNLSVNRLLMRRAVLRNKIMAFLCVGGIIMCSPTSFQRPLDGGRPGGGGRNILGLRTCTDAHLCMRQ